MPVRDTAVTMAAVLGSLGCALLVRAAAGLTVQFPILAVVLALVLRRTSGWQRLLEVPVLALLAGGVGQLVVHQPWIGQPLLLVGLSIGIVARRYGQQVQRAGRLVALPFLALLVTPVPAAADIGWRFVLWAPVAALIAVAWSMALSERGRPSTPLLSRPASPRRLDAPTRMALQMAVGLGAALVIGHLLSGQRWPWTVLSAFLVASGNRGRGDVLHKAGLRLAGAAGGTAAATLAAGALPPGHRSVLVLLFAVLAGSLLLRDRSYAYWAAGVTAMVALLHAYEGDAGPAALQQRLLGVLIGSAVGVAAAWWITPVRTCDVLRRRVFDALAALTDDLAEGARAPRFPAALARLDELLPTLRAARRLRRRPTSQPLDAVLALHAVVLPVEAGGRQRLRGASVRLRRALLTRDTETDHQLPPALEQVLRSCP